MAAPELELGGADGPFGIAVSGGGDSTALLLAAQARGLAARAATVDHGLRPGSAAEADRVRALCARFGVPHDVLPLGLTDGPALQARARAARYAALGAWARRHRLPAVLLGHTLDDVAETFLMRLADGVGLDGLAAMAPRFERDGAVFLRPLLGARRAALRAHLSALGIEAIEDPSNAEPRFERARVRAMLAGSEIAPEQIAASAAALRAVRRSVEARTRAVAAEIAAQDRGDWRVERSGLDGLLADDPEQARRLLLALIRDVGGGDHPPRRAEQGEMMRRVAARKPATLAGCLLVPEAGALRVAREPAAAARAADVPPGAVWDGRWRITAPPGAAAGLRVGALGAAVVSLDWRRSGLPRRSLMASPAVRDGGRLVAAPVAAPEDGWSAEVLRRRI